MPLPYDRAKHGISARRLFLWAALFVSGLFALGIGQIAYDQQQLLNNTTHIQEQTVPKIMAKQSSARNLEQLRQAGDNVFEASSVEVRQQAFFMTKLIAAHPSIKDDAQASALAEQTQDFFEKHLDKGMLDADRLSKSRGQWLRLSTQLGLLIDDLFSESAILASQELNELTAVQQKTRSKLLLILPLFIAIVWLMLWSAHDLLVRPLQRMDDLLTHIDSLESLPAQPHSSLREITAVHAALQQLHALLRQKEQNRRALEQMAGQDDLTGLLNRRKFMESATSELNRNHRHNRPVAVAMADIDHFKSINDTYGHTVGDQVLMAFADVLKNNLRDTDLVGRIGGEEFAFILPETETTDAQQLMNRIRQTFHDQVLTLANGQRVRATVSLGIADAADVSLVLALKQADTALYKAKSQGRDQVVVLDSPLH